MSKARICGMPLYCGAIKAKSIKPRKPHKEQDRVIDARNISMCTSCPYPDCKKGQCGLVSK